MEDRQIGLVAAFAAWLRKNERSAATVEKYAREAAAFISFLGGETEITEHGITSAADGRESVPVADVHGIVTASDERERVSVADGCGIVPAADGREIVLMQKRGGGTAVKEKETAPVVKEKMLAPATKDCLIGTVTKERVIAYKELLASRWCARSVNGKLAAVNALLCFLGLPEHRVKALKFQRQTFCPPERELTRAEFGRLVRAAEQKQNRRLCLLLQTLCGAGVRVSELPFITVEAAKAGAATVRCKGKTRTVFLVKELRKKLLRFAAASEIESGPVFVTRSGKPLDRSNVWREMKGLCKPAKVDPRKVFPHNLRHLFARAFYELEKDIVKLADILGHSSVDTTRIYTVSTGAEHRRKLERMKLVI